MTDKTLVIKKEQLKKNLPDIKSGDLVRVHQKIKEKNKERIQIFEGRVIARKHGKGINSTITVRRVMNNVGVEKIFPIHSPVIEKIEVVSRGKVRRAKLYYLRAVSPKKARLKKIELKEAIGTEPEPDVKKEEIIEQTAEQAPEKQESQAKNQEKSTEKNPEETQVEEEEKETEKKQDTDKTKNKSTEETQKETRKEKNEK